MWETGGCYEGYTVIASFEGSMNTVNHQSKSVLMDQIVEGYYVFF